MQRAVKMTLLNTCKLFPVCLLAIHFCLLSVAFGQVPDTSQQISLPDALSRISKDFQVDFIYESSLLVGKRVSLKSWRANGKLETLLSVMLEPLSIGYYRVDKNNYALFKLSDGERKEVEAKDLGVSVAVQERKFLISGLVLDRSGKPLEYSTLQLYKNDTVLVAVAIADSIGRYRFRLTSAGKYSIRTTRLGYQSSHSLPFQFLALNDLDLENLVLDEAPRKLGQILVKPFKAVLEYRSDRTIINLDGGFQTAGFSIKDVLEISPGLMLVDGHFRLKGKQGAAVMIDGSIVKLPSLQLLALLRGIPAGAVSQIELIHAPSAKYDAQSKGGIINIKMLSSQDSGLSGNLSSMFSMGSLPKFTQNAAFNYSWSTLSLYVNYSYQNMSNKNGFVSENEISGSLPIGFRQQETGALTSLFHDFTVGATYQMDRKTSISVKWGSNTVAERSDFDRYLLRSGMLEISEDTFIRSADKGAMELRSNTLGFNADHLLGTKGHMISFSTAYTGYSSKLKNAYQNTYLGSLGQTVVPVENLLANAHVELDLFSAGVDYTYPIAKDHQLETGGKLDFSRSDSRILFQYDHHNTQLITDFSRTNSFRYTEKISSAYINYKGLIRKAATLQLGIRSETTDYTTAAIVGDQATSQRYTQFFPNVLLSYVMGRQTFSIAYNRGLGRPSYQDLNPFITYYSPFHYAVGNQFLTPETTHSLELGYSPGAAANLSLSYSHTDNFLGTILSLQEGGMTTRQGVGNFGDYNLLNLTANYQKVLSKFWKIRTSGSMFYDRYHGEYLGTWIKNSLFGFNFNILSSLQLRPKLGMEMVHFYQSKRARLAGENFGRYRADVSIKYRFLKDRANVQLSVTDIFYTDLNNGTNQFGPLQTSFSNRNENRRFNFGISYALGRSHSNPKIKVNKEPLDRIK